MDINEALRVARKLSAKIMEGEGADDPITADAMASAFSIIDEWLTGGGFLPQPWRAKPRQPLIKKGVSR